MLDMKKMIRADQKSRKLKTFKNSFAPRHPHKSTKKRQRNKFEKVLFLKRFFESSFYLIHF